MKIMRILVNSILIILLLTSFSYAGLAQNLEGKRNTLIQYELEISDQILNALDPNIPRSDREIEIITESKNLLIELLYPKSFEILKEKLGAQSIKLASKDTLKTYHVDFNAFDFPDIMIPKPVIKNLQKEKYEADYYLSFNLSFNQVSDIFGSGKLIKQCKVEAVIYSTIFDNEGRKLKRMVGRSQSENPIKAKDFPEKKFDKTDPENIKLLVDILIPILDQATDKMLQDF